MRKSISTNSVVAALNAAAHMERSARNWMPTNAYPTVALDPRHWSTRRRQVRQWGLIEVLTSMRTLH